ncbi:hypothetical protein [Arenicella xantha]|uniref:Tissue inhibitor of metalloproteinase n=1 Tax=Arenicella xantha TaxID=644221 RepID=A0A395JH76_9GAMM|nr:hypothetical protein [Arenicella xantha]RBP45615.1 hypothetical protein DFR28_1184 [Arenicella xantha]
MRIKYFCFVVIAISSFDVSACKCPDVNSNTLEYSFTESEWVFVGTYQKEEFDKINVVRKGFFDITQRLKGDFGQFSFITRPITSYLSCAPDIGVGLEYVVFVPKDRHISACNFTRMFVLESQNEFYVFGPKTVKLLEQFAK